MVDIRMLPVLANATLTSRNVAAARTLLVYARNSMMSAISNILLARLGSSSGHCDGVVVCCRFRECWVQLRV